MPTNAKVKTFATGMGSYTHPGLSAYIPTQGSSGAANYKVTIGFIAPYVSGILPGRSIGQKAFGNNDFGIVRAVYLTTTTAMSGTGVAGAGATAKLLLYRAGVVVTNAVASLAFNLGTDTAALTPKALTLSTTTTSDVKVRFGDTLVFQWLQGATGLALPESSVQVDIF